MGCRRYLLSLSLLMAPAACPHPAYASVAFDNAADHTYDSGLTAGMNGGAGYAAWLIGNSGNAGAFIGSSTGNGGTGNIDSSGRAFGANAATNNFGGNSTTFLARSFSQGALQAHQTFSFDLDMSTSLSTFQEISLAEHDTLANPFSIGPSIVSVAGDYQVVDNGSDIFTPGMRDSGIPASQAAHAVYTINANDTYSMTLSSLASSLTYSTSGPVSNFALNTFYAAVDAGSPLVDTAGALYFNNLGIDVPEPSRLLLVPLAGGFFLTTRRQWSVTRFS